MRDLVVCHILNQPCPRLRRGPGWLGGFAPQLPFPPRTKGQCPPPADTPSIPSGMLSSYSNSQPPLLEYYPAPLLPLDHWSCIEYCLGSLFSPFITGAVCSNLSYASSGSTGAQKVSRSNPASFSKRAKDPRSERSRTRDLPRESLAH